MIRLLMAFVVLLMVGVVALPGCEEQSSTDAAAQFGVQEGTRAKDQPKRAPPGPPAGEGFTASGGADADTSPDEGEEDDDSDD